MYIHIEEDGQRNESYAKRNRTVQDMAARCLSMNDRDDSKLKAARQIRYI